MATYALLGSFSTVQVLSAQLVNPVVYCTIQTQPSGVVASIPVQESVFNSGSAGVELTNFADAIEQIMSRTEVVAAVGGTTLDANGLLADNVVFTVQYTNPNAPGASVTAEATVPVNMLNFSDAQLGTALLDQVIALITAVYDDLQRAAAG